ncbi:hypothetical protein EPUS_07307 [Endocarpon pusillum Z07020]|uniref:Uncharacterized protein n=1 Tax=Endocarpon pusillum (strain Z07020 / HMAS-L-300199) TaxID=1263415 RepID=U1GFK3_ENDPU|nr:uncharacterized protein EPUS_07307 [Endocarpon pusillum Z07020]ERF76427.1 hypothetical protein EPUS_07307 [Endocarpon pusillum Z07020]
MNLAAVDRVGPLMQGPTTSLTCSSTLSKKLSLTGVLDRAGFDDPVDVDSGYATGASTTPKSIEKQHLSASRSDQTPSNSRSLPGTFKHGKLLEFDQAVSNDTIEQYKRIAVQLEVSLVEYIQKHYRTHSPMSMRLMVLGQNADCAKPWIVVFCHEKRERYVRRFFNKRFARDLCQPQELGAACFDVLVLAHRLQLTSGSLVDVLTDYDFAVNTLSGVPILLSQPDGNRCGTLGGLIKITREQGDYGIYGLTAAHLLGPLSSSSIDEADTISDTRSDDGNSTDSTDDDDENDYYQHTDSVADVPSSPTKCAIEEEAEPSNVKGWCPLGQVHASTGDLPSDQPSRGPRHDWALVTINKNANLRPNRLRSTTLSKLREADLLAPSPEKMELSRSRHVALNTYGECCQTGTLDYLPCSVWLNRSVGFVKAFPLKMNEGAHIKRGDSGGWVVEYHTLEVYGHLVASDVLGDGYVIPLLDTLEDIRERTHAQDVGLATGVDITCKLGDAYIKLPQPATRYHDSGYASADISPPWHPCRNNYRNPCHP